VLLHVRLSFLLFLSKLFVRDSNSVMLSMLRIYGVSFISGALHGLKNDE